MTPSDEPFQAGPDDHRLRLERYLQKVRPDLSRRRIASLTRAGAVWVNGGPRGPGYYVKRGDRIEIRDPTAAGTSPPSRALDPGEPRLLARLPELAVVGKPPGFATVGRSVAGKPGTRGVLEWLAQTLAPAVPGVVHRLDRDTSGVLLFSLAPDAHRQLVDAFRRRQVRKTYLALVLGRVHPTRGSIELPLRRDARGRVQPGPGGLRARTDYEVLRATRQWSLLRVFPLTGRMHQIRVHLAAVGHPVAGDRVYGRAAPLAAPPPRLWLHARRIELPRGVGGLLGLGGGVGCPLWGDLTAHLQRLSPRLWNEDL
jgi:23S rRNA pseudouridine1911/1915/1917 synthase